MFASLDSKERAWPMFYRRFSEYSESFVRKKATCLKISKGIPIITARYSK